MIYKAVSPLQGEWWAELGVCVMCFMETQFFRNNNTLNLMWF